ncbi:FAD-binding oxidoreductase [bacterium]|nr:FAD-binding oxidoreductase [bacterium]MBU1995406.1 FAD-binding oxidoreductase [bacterium]
MYDIAVIGAGINGCSVAHEFTSAKKNVVIFDMDGVASGGSGAAGAFISPKFSKSGALKELIHDAFVYSMEFYEEKFSHLLQKVPLLHIAQDMKDSETLSYYKQNTVLELNIPPEELLEQLTPHARSQENVYIDAGVINAEAMCNGLCKDAKFIKEKINSLVYDEGVWILNEIYSAKEVVLATGAYKALIKEPYINIRGVWGHRIDIKTATQNKYSIHQYLSISPSKNGILALGATHNVHYHPQKNKEPYDVNEGRAELLEKASRTMELKDIEVIKDYTGLRSGSFDYLPLVGGLVLSHETMECCEKKVRVKKPDFSEFAYYPNLYMINGNGGYGFVLAPYLAKKLCEYILSGKKIDDRLSPARFFARWAKKK